MKRVFVWSSCFMGLHNMLCIYKHQKKMNINMLKMLDTKNIAVFTASTEIGC